MSCSPARRRCLQWLGLGALPVRAAQALPARPLVFPRDFGAHPELRTEWWYITGAAQGPGGREFGFQLTFFRTRVDAAQGLRSRFAAKQLIFAHAAVTDLAGGVLLHDQRIAREGFGLAQAATEDTDLRLDSWTLQRTGEPTRSRYSARLPSRDFGLALDFASTQPLLRQGVDGLSRKGPEARQASYYYSQPQLLAQGLLTLRGERLAVQGRAWLDHEWSEELLHPEARGWDWVGMNLDDGSALTAFRLRRENGSSLWDGGSWRAAGGTAQNFAAGSVRMQPHRWWTSPLTQARYPVQWQLDTPAGRFGVHSRLDAQELDSRASTGAVYWEGLSELRNAQGARVGQGYLEMTGYAAPLRLS
jgi:predicted secreted hydrolase